MPEAMKNYFSLAVIEQMGGHLRRVHREFDTAGFVQQAGLGLETLELKQRSARITEALAAHLPANFETAVGVMLDSLHPEESVELSAVGMDERGIRGWAIMPMSELIGLRCREDFDLALKAQKALTKRFSAEFGIRHSILADPEHAMGTIASWTGDNNYHVRRLASEGTRPRLPWAMQLPGFIKDPRPVLPVLEALKDDPSEYVRRSVANNLNDISKDHPDLIGSLARDWLEESGENRRRTVRHACRTLVKRGHPGTLAALGFAPALVDVAPLTVKTPVVKFGEALIFETMIRSQAVIPQKLAIDYVVHFMKANGKTAAKVFKLKTAILQPGQRLTVSKRHSLRPITTRRYYPGAHAVELQINGTAAGKANFLLTMDAAHS